MKAIIWAMPGANQYLFRCTSVHFIPVAIGTFSGANQYLFRWKSYLNCILHWKNSGETGCDRFLLHLTTQRPDKFPVQNPVHFTHGGCRLHRYERTRIWIWVSHWGLHGVSRHSHGCLKTHFGTWTASECEQTQQTYLGSRKGLQKNPERAVSTP